MEARASSGPPVIHAEVPDCALAYLARVQGWVRIRVAIGREGRVTSTAFEHRQPMTDKCSQAAAEKWLFAPSDRDEAREALLSFLFVGEHEETDEPSHPISTFDDPWTMRLAYAESRVRWLPREDGEIPEKRCPVHGEVMKVEIVAASYGLPIMREVDPENPDGSPEEQRWQAEARAYFEAREKLFPEINRVVHGGCIVGKPKEEVYYCPVCRDAEEAWLASHPGFDPDDPDSFVIPKAKEPE
jgi:hypothetical protein